MSIHILDLHFLKQPHTIASYLVPDDVNGHILVESGPYSTFQTLQDKVAMLGYKFSDIRHVLLTHIHFDHAGAAWALARQGAKIYVHPAGYKHLQNPEKLYNSAKMIYKDQMESLWGIMKPIDEEDLVQVEHEQVLKLGIHKFTAYHTPGHAVHHIAWLLKDYLFTGDAAGVCINGGPVAPPCPPPDIQLETWKESIEMMRQLPVKQLCLTQFGMIPNTPEFFDDLLKRMDLWALWIKERFDKNMSAEEITPLFTEFVQNELLKAGMPNYELKKYNGANPSWMSVAGLLRYWSKVKNR